MNNEEKAKENRLRRLARKQGYNLRKSRAGFSGDNLGGYMIIGNNVIVAGEHFEMSLDDVEKFLKE